MYDVAVVGLGAIGSAAAREIAVRGYSVVGLDRWHPPHLLGSAHSKTRLFREAWYHGSPYVPLLEDARERWAELDRRAGGKLTRKIGALMIGPPGAHACATLLRDSVGYALDVVAIPPPEARLRCSWLRPQEDDVIVFEPSAVSVAVEPAIDGALADARQEGATLRFDEPLVAWTEIRSGIKLKTAKREYEARRLILAAGAWTEQLLSGVIDVPLKVERTVQYWFERPTVQEVGTEGSAWVWELEGGHSWYGFPPSHLGVKTGWHIAGGRETDVGSLDRTVHAGEVDAMRSVFRTHAPDVGGELLDASVCMYTMTPDHDFVLDRLEGGAVSFFAGGSGHAFKFAPALGELLADLATDTATAHDISAFSAHRFGP